MTHSIQFTARKYVCTAEWPPPRLKSLKGGRTDRDFPAKLRLKVVCARLEAAVAASRHPLSRGVGRGGKALPRPRLDGSSSRPVRRPHWDACQQTSVRNGGVTQNFSHRMSKWNRGTMGSPAPPHTATHHNCMHTAVAILVHPWRCLRPGRVSRIGPPTRPPGHPPSSREGAAYGGGHGRCGRARRLAPTPARGPAAAVPPRGGGRAAVRSPRSVPRRLLEDSRRTARGTQSWTLTSRRRQPGVEPCHAATVGATLGGGGGHPNHRIGGRRDWVGVRSRSSAWG